MTDSRPDPDALLAQVGRDAATSTRGRLRIYLGAAAGVGKTCAMLVALRAQQMAGVDGVVGAVETHGREGTRAFLDGLAVLPPRRVERGGRQVEAFDLDAALARHPALLVVDELPHSNPPGSRHPKRWQDVDELLAAGIDVYTAMNVQHLESLNDVVGGITGVRVRETVPDRFFDRADEVVLVDVTPDELLARLGRGQIYPGDRAGHAAGSFFRKGNLVALRELALRRTADRADADARAWRREQSVDTVWRDGRSLLACVGPGADGESVVRAAARLAAQLGAGWEAVYVETPRLQRLPEAARRRVLAVLQLAESLGARTATLPGQEPAAAIAEHARTHNFPRVVAGQSTLAAGLPWRRGFAARLVRGAPEVEVIVVPTGAVGRASDAAPSRPTEGEGPGRAAHGIAAAGIAALTLALLPLAGVLQPANIVMLFLLAVVGAALALGRGPAALAAVLGVGAFDFFFVPPRFTFAVADVEYVVTFAVMLAVGLVVGQLTSGLRYQLRAAGMRERRADGLYRLARDLSAALAADQIAGIADRFAREAFRGRAQLLLPGPDDRALSVAGGEGPALDVDAGVAQWVQDHAEAAGLGTHTLPGHRLLYLPLQTTIRCRGVLAVDPGNPRWAFVPEQRRFLETFATLTAIAIERIHFVDVARDALVHMESERVRNALLASISHDLRTPLAGILGAATSLADLDGALTAAQRLDLQRSIAGEARRMSDLVANVLEMARLESGRVAAAPQWVGMDEVVGAALSGVERLLVAHPVRVDLPAGTMLVHLDPTLADQLLVNLLSNAARHTPPGTPIDVSARHEADRLVIEVADRGPGFGSIDPARLFDRFQQGHSESAGGVGLGLAICRAIAQLHGGTVSAAARDGGGALFRVVLPQPSPPDAAPEEGA